MQRFILLFILIITANFNLLFGQSTTVKIAPLDAVWGRYTLSGEYAFNPQNALIFNVQYRNLERDYNNPALVLLTLLTLSNETYQETGMRFEAGYRRYFFASASQRMYAAAGLGYRQMDLRIHRSGLFSDTTIIDEQVNEISLWGSLGMQWQLGERFVLDTGFIMRHGFTAKNYNTSFFRKLEQFTPRLDVKLGYWF